MLERTKIIIWLLDLQKMESFSTDCSAVFYVFFNHQINSINPSNNLSTTSCHFISPDLITIRIWAGNVVKILHLIVILKSKNQDKSTDKQSVILSLLFHVYVTLCLSHHITRWQTSPVIPLQYTIHYTKVSQSLKSNELINDLSIKHQRRHPEERSNPYMETFQTTRSQTRGCAQTQFDKSWRNDLLTWKL